MTCSHFGLTLVPRYKLLQNTAAESIWATLDYKAMVVPLSVCLPDHPLRMYTNSLVHQTYPWNCNPFCLIECIDYFVMKNINFHSLNYIFTITFIFVQVVTDIHDKFVANSSAVTAGLFAWIDVYCLFPRLLNCCCCGATARLSGHTATEEKMFISRHTWPNWAPFDCEKEWCYRLARTFGLFFVDI